MKLHLKNWIGFQTLSLTLEPGQVHILTGATGAGKSSVVDAITYACIGVARGYTAKKDAALFKINPTGPMSVRVDYDRDDLKTVLPWPTMMNRTTSKYTIEPADSLEAFRQREDQIAACLGAWSVLGTKAQDRAAMMASVTSASGFDPAALLSAVRKECMCPDLGVVFNDIKWGGGWKGIAEAEANAVNIRRSYHAQATGKVPPAVIERMEEAAKEIEALKAEMANGSEPEELVALKTKVNELQTQIEEVTKHPRPSEKPPVKDADFAELKAQHEAAVSSTGSLTVALQEINPFVNGLVEEFEGEAIDKVAAWRDSLKQRLDQNRISLTAVTERRQGLEAKLEEWRSKLALFTESESKRSKLGAEIAKIEKQIEKFTDPRQRKIDQIQQRIDADNETIRQIESMAETASQKRANWDKIVKALAPDGTVASAMMQEASGGISAERIALSSEKLGIGVKLGNDGTVIINSLSERQPSRGQRLLAGLVLQDAFCQAFGVPLMMVDELESLSGDCLQKAISFLTEIADDYESVITCLTGKPSELRYSQIGDGDTYGFPEGVAVWHCQGGTVQRVPDHARQEAVA